MFNLLITTFYIINFISKVNKTTSHMAGFPVPCTIGEMVIEHEFQLQVPDTGPHKILVHYQQNHYHVDHMDQNG
jgi:ribosomal protein L11